MTYEDFVAYSCIAIVLIVTFAVVRWIIKSGEEHRKRREKFERRAKEIEDAVYRGWETRRDRNESENSAH